MNSLRRNASLALTLLGVTALSIFQATRGEWILFTTVAIGVPFLVFYVFFYRRRAASEVKGFGRGGGTIRAVLAHSSVPAPYSGVKLLPSITRESPGLPIRLALENEWISLRKEVGFSAGHNQFLIRVPYGAVLSVAEAAPEIGVGGRSLQLGTRDGAVLAVHLPLMAKSEAEAVVAKIEEARSAASPGGTRHLIVEVDGHKRNHAARSDGPI